MDKVDKKLVAIEKVISTIKERMATKDDLKGMASKTDLKNLEKRLLEKMDESQMEIIAAVDKHKADKEDAGLPPYLD